MAAEAVEIGRQHNAKHLLGKISEDPSATALASVTDDPMSASQYEIASIDWIAEISANSRKGIGEVLSDGLSRRNFGLSATIQVIRPPLN
jgi:hypothetical protein